MTPIERVERAIALVADRAQRYPGYESFALLDRQLRYVRAVLLGHETNRAALHQIGIGAIAVKEFDETDVELAEALKAAHCVAVRIARGLKID